MKFIASKKETIFASNIERQTSSGREHSAISVELHLNSVLSVYRREESGGSILIGYVFVFVE